MKSSGLIVSVLARAAFAAFLILVAAHALPAAAHLERYKLLYRLCLTERGLEAPASAWLRANLPVVQGGVDLSAVVIGAALLALWTVLDHQKDQFARALATVKADARKAEVLRQTARAAAPAKPAPAKPAPAKPASAPVPPPAGDLSQREHLLELYAQTKRSLEEQKKHLAFLAIDVVDSTGMKVGEDSALAERDFRQYKKMVERLLSANNALKAAWTPDGVMICFPTVADAVRAAQGLILELDRFNREVKTIKADFRVRCGINAGRVMFDESVRMEEMTDRCIDIAGHMQKYAAANTICVGAHALEGLDGHGFRAVDKQIDACGVCEWRPDGSSEARTAARAARG